VLEQLIRVEVDAGCSSSLSDLKLSAVRAKVRQVILAAFGALADEHFRTIDRQTSFLLPPLVDEWLPEKHLARFVVEAVDGLDTSAMSSAYRGSGSA